jgi:hypothetical protein
MYFINLIILQTSSTGNKQSKLLAGMIVRKRSKESENDIVDDSKKTRVDDVKTSKDDNVKTSKENNVETSKEDNVETSKVDDDETSSDPKTSEKTFNGLGALAGLGSYCSDSDDEDET